MPRSKPFVSLALLLHVAACGPAETGAPPGGVHNVVDETDRIPMRDGVALHARVLRPEAEGRYPTLVYRTPYGADRMADTGLFPLKAAKAGYLVILVDVRGRYGSEGEFVAYRHEKEDGYDTIEWAASHPISNGRVGTWGGSYPGYVQWLALSQGPPHLVTTVPDMTPVGSHHFFYQGGAFNLTWYEWFVPLILPDLRRRAGDRSGPWEVDSAAVAWQTTRDSLDIYAARPLTAPDLLREHAAYYYDWLTHPDSGAYWDFAQVQTAFDSIRAPVLIVDGWFDNAYGLEGATRGFKGVRTRGASPEARRHTRLVVGPWGHQGVDVRTMADGDLDFGPNAGLDLDAYLLRWFDRRLKGVVNGIDEDPPVLLFVMGENRWRTFDDWPPPGTEPVAWRLAGAAPANTRAGGGRLVPPYSATPDAGRGADTLVFDPADPVWNPRFDGAAGPVRQAAVESREDVLVYTTAPLEEAVFVAGEVVAELWVSSDARDTDFAFMIADVHPDGTSYNLAGPEAGFLRMRYRGGYHRQVLMEPDSIYRIRIGGLYTANRFEAGHRIRVQVTSSRAPDLDPNPNTGNEIATETRLVPATNAVWHDDARPSRVWLPIRDAG